MHLGSNLKDKEFKLQVGRISLSKQRTVFRAFFVRYMLGTERYSVKNRISFVVYGQLECLYSQNILLAISYSAPGGIGLSLIEVVFVVYRMKFHDIFLDGGVH